MAKKIRAVIKLQLPARRATPAPPVGPAIGGHGANIMAFCRREAGGVGVSPTASVQPNDMGVRNG